LFVIDDSVSFAEKLGNPIPGVASPTVAVGRREGRRQGRERRAWEGDVALICWPDEP